MPQELFVYLSKRLYEEFGYMNPNSIQFQEMYETVTNLQGISDEEILQQREAEEDPFKCDI
jgi:Fe-S-cluster formation regulator IscX/YfhJ